MESTTQTVEKAPETATQLITKVKRATRRRFTAEDKIRIVIEGLKREVSTSEHCRRYSLHPNRYYSWTKDFMEGGKARLQGDTTRQANAQEVEALQRENERLKLLVAEQMLENTLLKKSLTGVEGTGTIG